ncbi:RCC1/BLIP-II protein [Mollisia scopiformis]|uniref:RCC1/BLIP-II protein n=1 Tax=Mollisia scopiformis TaxID=149040 RepID=A0A194XDP5_MOLSC|nr:RCC1/BLIP-II protein [Mollisia scopiformis]KUJ18274.1 RCC1/BLIP-II protein [Mollisia scopiformis]
MELWASGFNAWGQLDFEEVPGIGHRDLKEFKCILTDKRIEIVRTTLSATLVKTSAGLRTAGCFDDLIEHCISKQDNLSNLAIAGNDIVVCQSCSEQDPGRPASENTPAADPINANESVLKQYKSFDSYLNDHGEKLRQCGGSLQVVANQCTFTLLTSDGQVWTWGDGRYEACLGREISDERPAATPCTVEDLSDVPNGPIRKISSGGYVTAALTNGNDLYVWGGRPGQSKLLEDLTGAPMPLDLEGEDVLDVAVGVNHMLILTTERKLFVVGEGSNGQLGLDEKEVPTWKQVILPLKDSQRIASVHAGYKNSLVIVEEIT